MNERSKVLSEIKQGEYLAGIDGVIYQKVADLETSRLYRMYYIDDLFDNRGTICNYFPDNVLISLSYADHRMIGIPFKEYSDLHNFIETNSLEFRYPKYDHISSRHYKYFDEFIKDLMDSLEPASIDNDTE